MFENFHAFINAQGTAVQRNMVILRMPPFHICIETMVGCASFVFFFQTLFGGFFTLTVYFDNSVGSEGHIRVNEYRQTVCFAAQKIIRTASNNHTGFLLSQLRDDPALNLPEIVFVCRAESTVGQDGGQKTVGSVFPGVFDVVFRETAFQCNLMDQLAVVAGNTKLLGQLFTDGAAAAAKFTADSYDSVFIWSRLLSL